MCVMVEWARARTWREGQWPRCVALRMDTYIVLFSLFDGVFFDVLRLPRMHVRIIYSTKVLNATSILLILKLCNGIVCKQQCSVIYATPLPDFKLQLAEITSGSAESQLLLVFCLEFFLKNKVARVWLIHQNSISKATWVKSLFAEVAVLSTSSER